MSDLLIGRRAVYTRINRERKDGELVEVGRELFRGRVVALIAPGDYIRVVMLYDDGSLRDHQLENVTLEGESPEGALR